MSWPSFLRGIIDRFKKGEGDSDNGIQVKETEESKSRGWDCIRNQERGRDPPSQRHERRRQGQQEVTVDMVGSVASSGINNIGNNVLLNLDVGPGERDINSLSGVAVCYDTNTKSCLKLFLPMSWGT